MVPSLVVWYFCKVSFIQANDLLVNFFLWKSLVTILFRKSNLALSTAFLT